jgi:hypothetical protein
VHDLITRQTETTPDAVVLVAGGRRFTYVQLNANANQLARFLRAKGVGPEIRVGLGLKGSVELVVAMLGILKAGGAYVPLDPKDPAERHHLQDSGAKVDVSIDDLSGNLSADCRTVVRLDADWPEIARENHTNTEPTASLANPAYVIYTSGSTGRPRGVIARHSRLVNLLGARLLTKIEKLFGKKPSMSMLFQAATIRQLAVMLERPGSITSQVMPVPPVGSLRPFFCIGAGPLFRHLAFGRGHDRPFLRTLFSSNIGSRRPRQYTAGPTNRRQWGVSNMAARILAYPARTATSLREHGAAGTIRILIDRLRDYRAHQRAALMAATFDATYNVETARETNGANLREATWYQASHHVRITDIVRRFGVGKNFTFVDIGSGKGRAVLAASMLPLYKAIGVEYDAELHRIAQDNARQFSGEKLIEPEFICADATTYALPIGSLLVFMNNPFTAPLMRIFLDHLRKDLTDNPRPVLIVYTWPFQRHLLREQPWLRLIWDTGYCCVFRNK